MTHIRKAGPDDRADILRIAESSGLFGEEELLHLAGDFDAWAADAPDDRRLWFVADAGMPAGAALVAPEAMSDNVWNMLFIAVRPGRRRRGLAGALLTRVEIAVRKAGGRMLLIDTTGLEDQAGARAFYVAMRYEAEAVVRDYYGDGADRVTFRKRL